ncbi:hypothetical protein [Marinomonas sp. GJ51-6]|uniref:hypothetical protein n=1 Tax=Marinomonas sp. GJ51-6 TaxID=2992802 RepID=UPI0029343F47|nr:hypothetical protein [Marinomonas sp. GJ51-6]WOD06702.1 hypothetical protein ONZ50_13595 [Marinomonas sp. GJ51-6]
MMINKTLLYEWLYSARLQILAFVLGSIAICFATLTPAEHLPSAPGSDKFHHIIGFAGLAFMCAFGPFKRFIAMAFLIILLGGAIEIIQPMVNRNGEWADFYANVIGVLIVLIPRIGFQLSFITEQK